MINNPNSENLEDKADIDRIEKERKKKEEGEIKLRRRFFSDVGKIKLLKASKKNFGEYFEVNYYKKVGFGGQLLFIHPAKLIDKNKAFLEAYRDIKIQDELLNNLTHEKSEEETIEKIHKRGIKKTLATFKRSSKFKEKAKPISDAEKIKYVEDRLHQARVNTNDWVVKIYKETLQGGLTRTARIESFVGMLHPNISVPLWIGEVSERRIVTVSPYHPHEKTKDIVNRLTLDKKIKIATQTAKGLERIHKVAVHRDVKPENILVKANKDENGKITSILAKIIDFGIAKTQLTKKRGKISDGTFDTATGGIAGTPAYAAPEQIFSQGEKTHKIDIFSLAGTLYHYLTGLRPNQFPKKDSKHADKLKAYIKKVTQTEENLDDKVYKSIARQINLTSRKWKTAKISGLQNTYGERLKKKVPSLFNPVKHIKSRLEDRTYRKKVENLQLVMAGMMNDNQHKRYDSMTEVIFDLAAVKNNKKPRKIHEKLKNMNISKKKYTAEVFWNTKKARKQETIPKDAVMNFRKRPSELTLSQKVISAAAGIVGVSATTYQLLYTKAPSVIDGLETIASYLLDK